jgi:hypothetical protein
VAVFSVTSNIQKNHFRPTLTSEESPIEKSNATIDWQTILQKNKQFSNFEIQINHQSEQKALEHSVYDSSIVAIILDRPKYIILKIPSNGWQEIVLKEGEGWIKSWKIYKILGDKVIWENDLNREQYIQHLFSQPEGLSQYETVEKTN